jgi:choline-sulfatase
MRRLAAVLATLFTYALLPACASLGGNAAGQARPNVLILLADDLQWDALGALGDDRILTPNLDRLMSEGLTFTHMYNQGSEHGAVCMPSRAMFLTGRHLWRRGGDNVQGMPLMGESFGDAGYATFVTGKWHNGHEALQRGYQSVGPTGPGMLHSTSQSEDGYHRDGLGGTWLPDDETRKGHWVTGRDGDIVHSSTYWADEAITWMEKREASDDGRPFLAHVAFHAPHDPRQAPTGFLDQYPLGERPLPPNMLREHPFDNGALRLRDEQLASFPRSDDAVRLHMAEYAAIVSHLDQQVGRILDALDESGMADDTLVLFTADHGLSVGQHGLLGKQSLYDHSTRVSWVLRGPGIPAGRRSDALTYLHSTFPTLAELCDVAAPASIDTPSLAPLIRGAGESPHETLFAAYSHTQRMVRDRQHKLVLYPQVAQMQLFDLTDDPWEMENLADDPTLAPVIARLHGELLAWMDATEDPLDRADVALDRRWTVTSLHPPAEAVVLAGRLLESADLERLLVP